MPRRGWTGPPWWLLTVTVAGFLAALVLSEAPQQPTGGAALVSADTGAVGEVDPGASPPSQRAQEPDTLRKQVLGLATFNAYRDLTPDQTAHDAATLATNPAIDVIGWQEAYKIGTISAAMAEHGWATKRFTGPAGELAVSWRKSRFTYVGAYQKMMSPGVGDAEGNYPVGARFAVRVTLRDQRTGQELSVIDTHLPQAIEDLDRPGHWRPTYNAARARRQLRGVAPMWQGAPGRWTLGTGDYNFDADAEAAVKPHGGLTRTFAGKAVTSYQSLGTDIVDTHPVTGRHIDYVLAAADDVRDGRLKFLRQWTVPGLDSDHRALVVQVALT